MMSPAVLHLDVGCDLSEGNAELRQDRRRFAALEIRAGNIENREPKRLTFFRSQNLKDVLYKQASLS